MAFGHSDHSAADTHAAGTTKPSIGQKIGGAVDSLIGKATHKPEKVAEGETKKTGDPAHGMAAGKVEEAKNVERVAERRNDNDHSTLGNTHNNNVGTGLTGNTASGYDNNNLHNNNNNNFATTGTNTGAYGSGNQYGSGVTGAGVGHTGATGYDNNNAGRAYDGSNTGTGYDHNKPSAGEKISGGLQSMVGKATHNPEKVAEGEAKKTHDYDHARNEATEVRRDNLDRERRDDDNNTFGRDHNNQAGGIHGVQSQTSGVYSSTGVAHTDNTRRFEGETAHGLGAGQQGYDNNNTGLGGNRGYEGTNTGAGIGGHHDSRHGYENDKPGVGEKISGGLQSMVGKATHNPEKVAEGEAKKTHDYQHAQNEASEVRRDNLDRDRHDNNSNNTFGDNKNNQAGVYDNQAGAGSYGAGNTQAGGAYGVGNNQAGGAYGAGNTQAGGAYGSGATGGAYDNNAGNRY